MRGLLDSLPTRDQTGDSQGPKPHAGESRHWLTLINCSSQPEINSLNRALLTGLVLEAMLENPRLKEEPGLGGRHLKASLRSTLASQLAGHMSLAPFHSLAQGLEQWFIVVYPLLAGVGLACQPPVPVHTTYAVGFGPLREDLFSECLEGLRGFCLGGGTASWTGTNSGLFWKALQGTGFVCGILRSIFRWAGKPPGNMSRNFCRQASWYTTMGTPAQCATGSPPVF
jgi:hypothetical protein